MIGRTPFKSSAEFEPEADYQFANEADARRAMTLAQQALEARHKTWLGRSTVRTLGAGHQFQLTQSTLDVLASLSGGQSGSDQTRFLVTAAVHAGINNLPKDLQSRIANALVAPASPQRASVHAGSGDSSGATPYNAPAHPGLLKAFMHFSPSPGHTRRGHLRQLMAGLVLAGVGSGAQALVGGAGLQEPDPKAAWAGVGSLDNGRGGLFSAMLLDRRHVITAAHVVAGADVRRVVFRLSTEGGLFQWCQCTACAPGFSRYGGAHNSPAGPSTAAMG